MLDPLEQQPWRERSREEREWRRQAVAEAAAWRELLWVGGIGIGALLIGVGCVFAIGGLRGSPVEFVLVALRFLGFLAAIVAVPAMLATLSAGIRVAFLTAKRVLKQKPELFRCAKER